MNRAPLVAMHVCFLSPGNQSGYETRVIEETNLLASLGIRVVIVSFIQKPKKQKFLSWFLQLRRFKRRIDQATRAKLYVVPTSDFFELTVTPGQQQSILDPLVRIARENGVTIMHGQALYSFMHILRANDRIGAKILFDIHGVAPEETEMTGGHPSRIKAVTNWEIDALKKADVRIFVSSKMKSFFDRKYGFSNLPYTVIPCCVHPEKFRMPHETRMAKKARLGLEKKFIVLYLGTLSAWQWPKAMFSLFSQIYRERSDALFYLLLPHYEHEKARSFLREHDLPEKSFRMEEVPHSEVGEYIGLGDVGLLLREPSPVNYVSSPTKFGEYLAAGVPVIATADIGDSSGMLTADRVGLIVSASDDGVPATDLQRIFSLMDDIAASRREWADRCEKSAATNLDWPRHGRLLAAAYERLSLSHGGS